MSTKREIDAVTGTETTGHEWDGIKELNKPLPKWWVWVLYASIVWSIGYWIAYPAWPTLDGYTRGVLGYSQRQTVVDDIAAGRQGQAKLFDAIAKSDLAQIRRDPDLLQFAMAGGRIAFANNCAPCHGRGAQGAPGYPNLNDDDWLWGGKLEDIHTTIAVGIRGARDDTRQNLMPRFGLDQIFEPQQISDAADYVLSLAGQPTDAAAAGRGKQLYADNCAACHGDDGRGKQDMGAPNLTDAIWLYGGSRAAIVKSIETGRGGVMPAWADRLDPITLRQLAVYVHALGGGQQ